MLIGPTPFNLEIFIFILLSYAGFFRSDDVIRIRRNHITFHEGYMVLQYILMVKLPDMVLPYLEINSSS